MNKLKNQRGFAMPEILLVAAIIAVLSTIALPRMSYILDKVYLDYELKHLYSDLNFARDLSKSVGYNPTAVGDGNYSREKIRFRINYKSNKTEIHCTRDGKPDFVFNKHNLLNGITFDKNSGIKDLEFNESLTITLKSQFNNKAYIRIDTVGRIRGNYVKP